MGVLSSVEKLSNEDRKWLEQALLDRNFCDYDGLMRLLAERGLEVSRSAVGRFGKKYKAYIEDIKRSTDMARLMAEEVGDDANVVGDATIRMMQVKIFDALQDFDFEKLKEAKPSQMIRAIAELNRATVNQKKWMAQAKAKLEASKEALSALVQQGPTEETLKRAEEALNLL